MKICRRVLFGGKVQGVGFRFATQGVASHYAVAGFVRNLANGEVEVLAEGPEEQVNGFLAALERRMSGYIAGRTVSDEVPGDREGFVIRY